MQLAFTNFSIKSPTGKKSGRFFLALFLGIFLFLTHPMLCQAGFASSTPFTGASWELVGEYPILGSNGAHVGTATAQLALAYSYGDGAERSCELTSAAVSRLFYDLPIPAYGSIYMQGIRQLVDSVGGVTVTPDASFSGFTAGQPVTLTGQRTENYIRYRADSTEGNNQRMQRQKQVVLALVNKMLAQVKEDPASVLALYNDVRRNITTNINTAMMVYLAQQASGMHFSGDIVNVPGTSVMGAQKHAEYQVNPDALLEMVLDIFYEPVDG